MIIENNGVGTLFCTFATFKNLVENLFNCKIRMFQSDAGREFDQTPMHDLFLKHNIYKLKFTHAFWFLLRMLPRNTL